MFGRTRTLRRGLTDKWNTSSISCYSGTKR